MKKSTQIKRVTIDSGMRVNILDTNDKPVKVTRSQRNALTNWKNNPNYVTDIVRAFSNENILSSDYSVVQDGVTVFAK